MQKKIRGVCSIEGCNNKHYAHGYCSKHYSRLRIHGDPNVFLPNYKTTCSVEGCVKKHNSKGYCKKHLRAYELYGDPLFVKIRIGEDRFKNELYGTYRSMIARCTNKNHKNYKYYGGRGIGISNDWLGLDGFSVFIKDMGERPEGCTLDRIDVNGNYCKENCRWANVFTQSNNKRTNKKVGVYYDKRCGNYTASITHNKKFIYLGYYYTYEDAVIAREKYEQENGLYILSK